MYAKTITYKTLKEAVQVAFTGDDKIISLYDPNKEVNSIEEITEDVLRKIKEFDDGHLNMNGIYEKNILIGYFVFRERMLISFSMNVNYRTRSYLREFFQLIKKNMDSHFFCFLWTKNVRAIKYLLKHGMEIINSSNLITQLICP